MKRSKVLYVITKSNFGGAQRYVFDLATHMNQFFDVTVAFGGEGILADKLKVAGIKTISIPTLKRDVSLMNDIKSFFQLIKLIKSEKPEILHLNSSKIGALGGLAGRLTGVKKIIFTGHGWAFNEKRNILSKSIILFIHYLTIIFAHKTIAVSEKTRDDICKLPFIKNKIVVIYNGIDDKNVSKFDVRNINKNESSADDLPESLKKLYLEPYNGITIGTISELHKNKGLDFLIEAYKKFCDQSNEVNFNNSRLIIMGAGEEEIRLKDLAVNLGISNKVNFLGYVKDASIYLNLLDIFTLTSRTEAFPYVLLEAGLNKKPVIASNVGGIPKIIENNVTGLLVNVGDINEISRAMDKLIEPSLRNRLANNLYIKTITEFSIDRMITDTKEVYEV